MRERERAPASLPTHAHIRLVQLSFVMQKCVHVCIRTHAQNTYTDACMHTYVPGLVQTLMHMFTYALKYVCTWNPHAHVHETKVPHTRILEG